MKYPAGKMWLIEPLIGALLLFALMIPFLPAPKPITAAVDLTHPKLSEYRIIVRPSDDHHYFAIGLHYTVPSSIAQNVLQSPTANLALKASKDYPVVVKSGNTPNEALLKLQQALIEMPKVFKE